MNRAYIAAPIFTASQLAVVTAIRQLLVINKFEYFSPYEASQSIWRGRAPKDCTQEERDQVLRGNINNLHWAGLLIAWVGGTEDGRTDTGVTWEMGYFNALTRTGRHRIRFTLAYMHPSDVRKSMNLMLAGTVDAVVTGPDALDAALRMLYRNNRYGCREAFHPDHALEHEAEPIK